jgi:hypothetical protein
MYRGGGTRQSVLFSARWSPLNEAPGTRGREPPSSRAFLLATLTFDECSVAECLWKRRSVWRSFESRLGADRAMVDMPSEWKLSRANLRRIIRPPRSFIERDKDARCKPSDSVTRRAIPRSSASELRPGTGNQTPVQNRLCMAVEGGRRIPKPEGGTCHIGRGCKRGAFRWSWEHEGGQEWRAMVEYPPSFVVQDNSPGAEIREREDSEKWEGAAR